jgi:hypothetical protein
MQEIEETNIRVYAVTPIMHNGYAPWGEAVAKKGLIGEPSSLFHANRDRI